MKNKLFILVLLLAVLIIPTKEVFAEGEEVNNKISWKKTTDWNYPATIEIKGIDLYIYNRVESEEESDVLDENYLNYNPDKKISLDLNKYKLNLSSKNSKFYKMPATYVDLGIDLKKSDLEELLATEIASTTNNKYYIVEVVVNYKVEKYPE